VGRLVFFSRVLTRSQASPPSDAHNLFGKRLWEARGTRLLRTVVRTSAREQRGGQGGSLKGFTQIGVELEERRTGTEHLFAKAKMKRNGLIPKGETLHITSHLA
jgi:hypothetical protein